MRPRVERSAAAAPDVLPTFAAPLLLCNRISELDAHHQAHAFSHFTYAASGEQLLVCDLQGVDNLLTDPQV